jgi:hypothetical protein
MALKISPPVGELKTGVVLNPKYPSGSEKLKRLLEAKGQSHSKRKELQSYLLREVAGRTVKM